MLKPVSVSYVHQRYVGILLVVDGVIRTLYPKLIQSSVESDIMHTMMIYASLAITACLEYGHFKQGAVYYVFVYQPLLAAQRIFHEPLSHIL